MMGKRNRWLAAALLTGVLVSGWSGGRAGAAGENGDLRISYSYTDKTTGEAFFNTERLLPDDSWRRRVVVRRTDGTLASLPEAVRELRPSSSASEVKAWTYGLKPAPFDEVIFNASAGLIARNAYTESSDGSWGIKTILYFKKFPASGGYAKGYGYEKRVSVLLKNKRTGAITELGEYPSFPALNWLPDGRILLNRFSPGAKQNEIAAIRPDSGKTERLFLGSLYGYNPDRGLALFARNEPTRRLLIHDFHTGVTRPAAKGEAESLFYNRPLNGDGPTPPALPDELDPEALPTADIAYSQSDEASITVGGTEVPLPYAFTATDRRLYIPLLPLSEPLGLKISRIPGDEYRYAIRAGTHTLTITPDNSKVFNERLFIQAEDLLSLGYSTYRLHWDATS